MSDHVHPLQCTESLADVLLSHRANRKQNLRIFPSSTTLCFSPGDHEEEASRWESVGTSENTIFAPSMSCETLHQRPKRKVVRTQTQDALRGMECNFIALHKSESETSLAAFAALCTHSLIALRNNAKPDEESVQRVQFFS